LPAAFVAATREGSDLQIGHRRWNRPLAWVFLLGAGAPIVASGISLAAGAEYREKVLYAFCARRGCADGDSPQAGLLIDGVGSLFGTTAFGGVHASGTVFELQHDPNTHSFTYILLYEFCSQNGCGDGSDPVSSLIMDAAGSLYGTTASGGAFNKGTVFELSFDATAKRWTETVLHSFCAENGCADGAVPEARLVMDPAGNIYGATGSGGSAAEGTVFELSFDPVGQKWKETVLHSFCSERNCADGASPLAGLIIDAAGNLYGTTFLGGAHGKGTVFELSFDAVTQKWTETVLHSFCPSKTSHCVGGTSPAAALLMDGAENLYGTTLHANASKGGTAFELRFDAASKQWLHTTLARFGKDRGGGPSELITDGFGNLYGTTARGGAGRYGTAFELSFRPAANKWRFTVRYSFCPVGNCLGGQDPGGGLVMDGAGNLYGTTPYGGAHGGGTVFELRP
jgi:uncharacterized repeat protein (TIGR03803 family)